MWRNHIPTKKQVSLDSGEKNAYNCPYNPKFDMKNHAWYFSKSFFLASQVGHGFEAMVTGGDDGQVAAVESAGDDFCAELHQCSMNNWWEI